MSRAKTIDLFPNSKKDEKTRSLAKLARANDLPGKEWTRNSISVWNDIRKTAQESKLGHPAMFPRSLVERLLNCFTTHAQKVVLDPFCGSGATLVAAKELGKQGIGFEVAKEYYELALARLAQTQSRLFGSVENPEAKLFLSDARELERHVRPETVDVCITSPPYWDILSRKRSADSKPVRDYAPAAGDLSKVADYPRFLDELALVFRQVCTALKPGRYCIVVVMDLRKQEQFYPFHSDLASRLSQVDVGLFLDDIIIWDRRQEYNNLRPLGYPTTFRINKIHEYLLIFRKPKG